MHEALAAAPAAPVSSDGTVAFGTYFGTTGPIDWSSYRGPRRRGAWKRWHYVSVAGPAAVAAVAVVDLGWASSAFAYLFDRRAGRLVADESALGLPRRAAHVSDRPSAGAKTTFRTPDARVTFIRGDDGDWQLSVVMGALVIDATLHEPPARPTLCTVAPVPGGVADCTHKTPCLGVHGRATADGFDMDLAGHWGAVDHTSGLLARATAWRWASASGPDIALNLTEGFTAPAENALWVGSRLERVGPVRFRFDDRAPLEPWHIADDEGEVDLTFTPEGLRREDKNLLLAKSRYVQPIGSFRGRVGGVDIDDVVGVTEDHRALW